MDKRNAKRLRQKKRRAEGRDGMARKAENKRKIGRPKRLTDVGQIERMAALGCSMWEIAVILGISEGTLRNRLNDEPAVKMAYVKGKAKQLHDIRRLQWKHAKGKNGTAMTIHMSKHALGEHEKSMILNLTVEDIDTLMSEMERRMMDDARKTSEGIENTSDAGKSSEIETLAAALAGEGTK